MAFMGYLWSVGEYLWSVGGVFVESRESRGVFVKCEGVFVECKGYFWGLIMHV